MVKRQPNPNKNKEEKELTDAELNFALTGMDASTRKLNFEGAETKEKKDLFERFSREATPEQKQEYGIEDLESFKTKREQIKKEIELARQQQEATAMNERYNETAASQKTEREQAEAEAKAEADQLAKEAEQKRIRDLLPKKLDAAEAERQKIDDKVARKTEKKSALVRFWDNSGGNLIEAARKKWHGYDEKRYKQLVLSAEETISRLESSKIILEAESNKNDPNLKKDLAKLEENLAKARAELDERQCLLLAHQNIVGERPSPLTTEELNDPAYPDLKNLEEELLELDYALKPSAEKLRQIGEDTKKLKAAVRTWAKINKEKDYVTVSRTINRVIKPSMKKRKELMKKLIHQRKKRRDTLAKKNNSK